MWAGDWMTNTRWLYATRPRTWTDNRLIASDSRNATHRSATAIKPSALYFEGYLCAGETAPIYQAWMRDFLGCTEVSGIGRLAVDPLGSSGFLGVVASMDRTFSGMSQRLGTGEFAGQVNALSCAHWHWGMPLTGGLLLGPQHCFGWLCVSIVKMQHPHECQDPGFPSRILTLHWMICVLLCLLWVLMFLLIAVYHVPQTTACLQHTSDRSTWSLSYSYSWLGLGTETTWLSLGTFCGLGLKHFTWRPPLPPWYLLRSLEVTLGS